MTFLPDITTLRLFIAVVEETSIARAARRERIAVIWDQVPTKDGKQILAYVMVTTAARGADGIENRPSCGQNRNGRVGATVQQVASLSGWSHATA